MTRTFLKRLKGYFPKQIIKILEDNPVPVEKFDIEKVKGVDDIYRARIGKFGVTVLVYGAPIAKDFHFKVLLVYAVMVSFLLHPLGIRLRDSLIFASVGFAALVFSQVLAVETMCKTENVEGEDSFRIFKGFYVLTVVNHDKLFSYARRL